MSQGSRTSFVVRVTQDGGGLLSGVIERVATGAKETFTGMEAIGSVIVQMLRRDGIPGDADTGTSPVRAEESPPLSRDPS
jgi:hypothetical protein